MRTVLGYTGHGNLSANTYELFAYEEAGHFEQDGERLNNYDTVSGGEVDRVVFVPVSQEAHGDIWLRTDNGGWGEAHVAITGTVLTDMQNNTTNASGSGGQTAAAGEALSFTFGGEIAWFETDEGSHQSGGITHGQASWMETTVTGPGELHFDWMVSSEARYDYLRVYLDDEEEEAISGAVDWAEHALSIGEGSHTVRWHYSKDRSISSRSDAAWVRNARFVAVTSVGEDDRATSSVDVDGFSLRALLPHTEHQNAHASTYELFATTSVGHFERDGERLDNYAEVGVADLDRVVFVPLSASAHGDIWLRIDGGDWGPGRVTINTTLLAELASGHDGTTDTSTGGGQTTVTDGVLSLHFGGDVGWFNAGATYQNGDGEAYQSGQITHRQSSWMETTVTGPIEIHFDWMVSSERGYDSLRMYVDDEAGDHISGAVDWAEHAVSVGAGSHTVRWQYTKDASVSSRSDAAWVRNIRLMRASGEVMTWNPPTITALTPTVVVEETLTLDAFVEVAHADGVAYYEVWDNATADGAFQQAGNTLAVGRAVNVGHDLSAVTYVPVVAGSESIWIRALNSAGEVSVDWVQVNVTTTGSAHAVLSDAFEVGGDAAWFDAGEAYQSGAISHNQVSWAEMAVVGPGTLQFEWTVSSERNYDYVRLFIDGDEVHAISGSVDWTQQTHAIDAGTHAVRWQYSKDRSVSSGSDAAQLRNIQFTAGSQTAVEGHPTLVALTPSVAMGETITLDAFVTVTHASQIDRYEVWDNSASNGGLHVGGNSVMVGVGVSVGSSLAAVRYVPAEVGSEPIWIRALDDDGNVLVDWVQVHVTTTGLTQVALPDTFSGGGAAAWFDIGTAYQSGAITHNQDSWTEMTVVGPGILSFDWMVSSESNYDYLRLYVDGEQLDRISGSVDWAEKSFSMDSGTHTVRWRYTKDGSASINSDAGWVRNIHFTASASASASVISFQLGGDAEWFGSDTDTYQSGVITHNQETWAETTVVGPGILGFDWMVSSEPNYDHLRLYVDGEQLDRISGSVDWVEKSFSIDSGTHTVRWRYTKDGSASRGSDAGWVRNMRFTASLPDTFSGGGAAAWFDIGTAYQSGAITHNQDSWTEMTVVGPGILSFDWMVSSESNYDYLRLYVDGEQLDRISGSVDWAEKSFSMDSGTHTVRWRYTKDGSASINSDAGWVRNIHFTASASASASVISFQLGGDAEWFGSDTDTYQSGVITHNQETWAETTVVGPGILGFDWMVSSEPNYDHLRLYVDGEQLDRISGSVDWVEKSFSIDSGTHTVRWRYTKDGSASRGSDAGWVRNMRFTASDP